MPSSAISFNSSGLPSGLVFPYAGNAVPSGFLECTGQEVDKTAYPNLYAAIQDTYATQTDPTTGLAWAAPAAGKFRVPDYRGIFLRGVGTASGKDAVTLGGHQGEKTKTPTNAFTTASASVSGTAAGQTFSGTTSGGSTTIYSSNNNKANQAFTTFAATGYSSGDSLVNTQTHTHTYSGTGSASAISGTAAASTVSGGGDNETRPVNKGVTYIIKV